VITYKLLIIILLFVVGCCHL